MQNKKPLNDKGQAHGLWEEYYSNGNLRWKGSFINGNRIGLWLWCNNDGSNREIRFYANE